MVQSQPVQWTWALAASGAGQISHAETAVLVPQGPRSQRIMVVALQVPRVTQRT